MLITADDFGMTQEINKACVKLFNNKKRARESSFFVAKNFFLDNKYLYIIINSYIFMYI